MVLSDASFILQRNVKILQGLGATSINDTAAEFDFEN
jgi:hypothetical protein